MFDIPLMGEGTGSVEALPSYLHRCAYHHAVTTVKFIEYLHREHNNSAPGFSAAQNVSIYGLLTYGNYPRLYVDRIKHLTGRNVINSTFLPFVNIFTQPLKEISAYGRWCPECFRALRDIGSEPYIKLIWHLSEVTHCPHHNTVLLDLCPYCCEPLYVLSRRAALDVCHKCGGDLKIRTKCENISIQPTWIHQAGDLLRLFTQMAYRTDKCFYQDGYLNIAGLKKSISDFSFSIAEPEFDRAYGYCWTNKEIRSQLWGGNKISLRTLRILAHLTNLDIFDLLTGNLINKTKSMCYLWKRELPENLLLVCKKVKHDHFKNFDTLNTLAQDNTPLSLKEVGRRSGLSIGYINYRFPVLKQKIVARHQQYIDQISLEKHHQSMQEAMRYFYSNEYINYPKSRKQALRHLCKITFLSKMYLKPAINEVYQHYHQQR